MHYHFQKLLDQDLFCHQVRHGKSRANKHTLPSVEIPESLRLSRKRECMLVIGQNVDLKIAYIYKVDLIPMMNNDATDSTMIAEQ